MVLEGRENACLETKLQRETIVGLVFFFLLCVFMCVGGCRTSHFVFSFSATGIVGGVVWVHF